MYIIYWIVLSLFVGISQSFLTNDSSYEKKRDVLWETWFNQFLTVPSHTIYLGDDKFIAFEKSTIIDSLFIGTFQLRKLANGSYILGNIVNNTKYGIIGLVHLDANKCQSLGWNHYNDSCFLALKRVDVSKCEDNISDNKSCSLVIISPKIEDLFTGSINKEIPMQRLDISTHSKCLYFISRNFDESKISKYQQKFRDFFNYNIHSYSLVDKKITETLNSTFDDSLKYLSAPMWLAADLVPKCLTLVHYDDYGFLVVNIIEYDDFAHRYTVTLGSIQSGYITEFAKTLNTPKIITIGDTPPFEKIIIVNGITGEIQRHDMYST